jgi:hypothetical protein
MADRVFCIDFGSAYTKVALRRDPSAESELISTRAGTTTEPSFCVPSTVAVDRRGPKAVPEFGDRAASLQPGGGIEVHRNWKKAIFQRHAPGAKPQQSPLETLLQSEELRELAARFGVAAGQVAHLQQLVGSARQLIGGRVVSAESQQHVVAASIAPHFFHWLRQQVLEACSRLPTTGLRFDSIPVRITIPAFDHSASADLQPGWRTLLDALSKAGWPLHPEQPTIAEPYANAIGVLTKGTNSYLRGKIRIGDMFGRSPLTTVMKDATHHPLYRAMVIDVGAYTTDFSALTMKPDDDNTSDADAQISVLQHSQPLGVSDLDLRMIAALPKEKGDWLRKAASIDWEDFRPAVYSEGKGVRVPDLGVVGGPADAEAVRACVAEFVAQLSAETAKFLGSLEAVPPGSLQELILTGGGSFVTAVRDALLSAAQASGNEFIKVHAPALKKSTGGPLIDKLDRTLARGAGAIGGASIYFEKSLY